jgi:hypothetical protein
MKSENAIPWIVRAVCGVPLLMLLTAPYVCAGAEQDDLDSYKLRIDGFWFYSQPSGTFRGTNGNGVFDLQKDVNFQSYSTPAGEIDWKFTHKNHFYLSATDFSQSQQVVLNRTVNFQGQTYNIGAVVNAKLQSFVLIPGYRYDIIRRKQGSFGVQVQLDVFDIKGTLSAAAQVNNGLPQLATASSGKLRAPLPVAGPTFRFYVIPNSSRLFVTANVMGMYFFGYGNYVSSIGTVGLTLTRNLAIRGGYQLGSRLNVNTQSDRIGLNLTQKGAVAGLEVSF